MCMWHAACGMWHVACGMWHVHLPLGVGGALLGALAPRPCERQPELGLLEIVISDAGQEGLVREELLGGVIEGGERGEPLPAHLLVRDDALVFLERPPVDRPPPLAREDAGEPRAGQVEHHLPTAVVGGEIAIPQLENEALVAHRRGERHRKLEAPVPRGLAVLGAEVRVGGLLGPLREAAAHVPVGELRVIHVGRQVHPAPADDAQLPLLVGREGDVDGGHPLGTLGAQDVDP